MNKIPLLLLSFALLCFAGSASAFGGGEKDDSKPKKVEVSGRVRMVGSSPMTSLVISGESREWHVEQEEQGKLMDLQQQTVTVKAKEYYHDIVFASGVSGGRRYFLKDITVISPK